MFDIVHQYGYLFSLLFFILPVSLLFDSRIGFRVLKAFVSAKGLFFILLSVVFWSAYDLLWIGFLGHFPQERIIADAWGVPLEEMLLFIFGFYNIATVLAWSKKRFG